MTAAALAAAVAGAVAIPGADAAKKKPAKPKPVTIGVYDNYYNPLKKTVKAGTEIRWLWSDETMDVHDVALKKGPKGVRKFQSDPLASGQTYRRKLTKPGTYSIICTFHVEMKMSIKVTAAAKKKKK